MSQSRLRRALVPLLLSGCAVGLFAAIAWSVHQQNALTRFDSEIARSLHEEAASRPAWKSFFQSITYTGSLETLLVVAFVASLALLAGRQLWLIPVWIAVLAGGEWLNRLLKNFFQRPRPQFSKPPAGWSFPSGHAMLSLICYGMLAYLLAVTLPRSWCRVVLVLLLVPLIGFSRMFLTAHYFSDVLGGYAAGAVWLGLWITGIEAFWRTDRAGPSR